ncbi:MAG: hypothetical protein WBX81_09820 [Nitrososphaeraceae archaeon]
MRTERTSNEQIDKALVVRLRNQTNDNLFVRLYEQKSIHNHDQNRV